MIGRYSRAGVYRELLQSGEFLRALLAGGLAVAGYLWDRESAFPTLPGMALALVSVALNGLPIVWGAIRGILQRRVNVDELVSLAIVASLLQGEFLTAAAVSFVMVVGSLVEEAASNSARKAIRSLAAISPQTADRLVDGRIETRPVSEIVAGDVLLVKPGDRVPVDGTVKKGVSAVDESTLTGESIPCDKVVGSQVYAGTLNVNGVLEVEATRVGTDTTLSRVIRLVSEAEAHKPRAARLMENYARWFTPTVLVCAALAWWLTGRPDRAVAVLIVGCPCVLILAAPTAIVATLGRAAKEGILVKGGQFIEEVGRAEVVLFDKTGTLTEGKPRAGEVAAVDGVDRLEVLTLAACAEQNSTHPLARAVLKAAHYAGVTLSLAEEMCARIGFGIEAHVGGNCIEVGSACALGADACLPAELRRPLDEIEKKGATPLAVYRDRHLLGIIGVADKVRPQARATVEELGSMGVNQVGLLSGDHRRSACMVAESLGITSVWWEMKPEDKLRVLKGFQESGKGVIFVGDGINDAPALAAANVGIAMGAAGTDAALETADIALMDDDISKIPFLIRLSRRMLRTIKWNIAFGFAFNTLAVTASGAGFLSPIAGALVHNVGTVLVVFTSVGMALTPRRRIGG